MEWLCKQFDDLTPPELYAILQLRSEVFVVEQHCVFLDADNKDQFGSHLMGWQDDILAAYARLLPPSVAYEMVSIGRVVTSPKLRRSGIGRELMHQSITRCYNMFGKVPIKIGAQLYLVKFYQSFGFCKSGDIYTEDGIDHVEMILS